MSADLSTANLIKDEELRIVLVGKTGAGKSATRNTILGRNAFESMLSFESLTEKCEKAIGVVDGRKVSVIDTPGLFDTRLTIEQTLTEIKQCICFAAPGPHVFLIVIKLGKFTEEEQNTVKMIQGAFGQKSNKYTMILFTHGDKLKDLAVEEMLKSSDKITNLISNCKDRYHVFNNNETTDRSQVTELLKKIESMVEDNGGSHYTNDMFQEAEIVIEEEKHRILETNEEQTQKEEEDLKTKYEGDELEKIITMMLEQREQEAREKAERSNTFLTFVLDTVKVTAGLVFFPVVLAAGVTAGVVVGTAKAIKAVAEMVMPDPHGGSGVGAPVDPHGGSGVGAPVDPHGGSGVGAPVDPHGGSGVGAPVDPHGGSAVGAPVGPPGVGSPTEL